MSVTYGFYNAKDHDRQYDAVQLSSIFDGLINDGIYATIGDAFVITAGSNMSVTVGTGRAWFNHTWTYNDAKLILTIPNSEVLLDRYDAVVLETNDADDVRANSIKVISGVAASSPKKPDLTNDTHTHQYPLAYIKVPANSTSVSQANIENCIGTSACPFVTGIVDTIDATTLFKQWNSEFDIWFDGMKGQLSTDAAGNLQTQINALKNTISTTTKSITLSASGWSSGTYTISDGLITATSNQEIIPSPSISADQYKALVKASLVATGQSAGSITIKAFGATPTINIPVTVIFRGEK
mgnify:CR=1 FL=1